MDFCDNKTVQEVVDSFAQDNKEEGLRVFVAGGSRPGSLPIYVEEEIGRASCRERVSSPV